MANDPRQFVNRNLGNPTNSIKENTVKKIGGMPSKSFSIPRDVGAANRPKRK